MNSKKIKPWKKVSLLGIALILCHFTILWAYSNSLLGYFKTLNLIEPWTSILDIPGRGGFFPFAFIAPFILGAQILFLSVFTLVPFVQILVPLLVVVLIIFIGILRRNAQTFVRESIIVFLLFAFVDLAASNFSNGYYHSVIKRNAEEGAKADIAAQKSSELELRPELNDLEYLKYNWQIYRSSHSEAPELFYFASPARLRTVVVEPIKYENPQRPATDVCGDFLYLQLAIFDLKSGKCLSNGGYGDPGSTLGIFWNRKNGDYKDAIEKFISWNATETELSFQREVPLSTNQGPVICHAQADTLHLVTRLRLEGIKRENFFECFNIKYR